MVATTVQVLFDAPYARVTTLVSIRSLTCRSTQFASIMLYCWVQILRLIYLFLWVLRLRVGR